MTTENYPAGAPRVLSPQEVVDRWRELGWGDPFLDAQRYRVLREGHWTDGGETLVVVRAKDLKPGVQTFSGDLLDEEIRRQQEKKP